mgnify:CR=1 FL=1
MITELVRPRLAARRHAEDAGVRVRGYLSTAFHCPFEGPIVPAQVLPVAQALLDLGVFELDPGDDPRDVDAERGAVFVFLGGGAGELTLADAGLLTLTGASQIVAGNGELSAQAGYVVERVAVLVYLWAFFGIAVQEFSAPRPARRAQPLDPSHV